MENFDLILIIGAFGGGVIGAYMGALPSFIMTGIIAIAGGISAMAGAADLSVGFIAFGAYLGPHVAFAGGVGAAAYAGHKKQLESGADILSSLNGLADPMTLLVGGIFGLLGMILFQIWNMIGLPTDLPGFTVVVLGIVARLLFGKTGLTGDFTGVEKRQWFSTGKELGSNIMLGLGIGTAIGFVAHALFEAGTAPELMASFPVICFGIAATTLIFTQTGFACPATHHIAYPAACAAVWSGGNPLMGVLFGVLGALIGDLAGRTFNTNVDTHIDPPATTIFILIFVCTMLWG